METRKHEQAGKPSIHDKAMTQAAQQADTEQRERKCYEVAARLQFAMQDGYLTPDEFEHCLLEFGILTEWKRSHK